MYRISELFPQLQTLTISVDGIGLVMPQLTRLCNLRSLDLEFTASDPTSLKQIASLSALRKISLKGPMPDQVVQAIGQNCLQLEVFHLHANEHDGDAGLAAIAEGCRILQDVSLSGLCASDDAIAKVVCRCSRVELVSVDVGSQTLDALADNASLKSFTCGDCKQVPEDSLSHLVHSSTTLQNLHIWDCETYLWLEPPSVSIRHLLLEGQRFLWNQLGHLGNWNELETLSLMYFGDKGWAKCMLVGLIQASTSLHGLRRVDWVSELPEDKKAELVAGLSP